MKNCILNILDYVNTKNNKEVDQMVYLFYFDEK